MVALTKKVLTDRAIKALRPSAKAKRYLVYDALTPYLAIRVSGHANADGTPRTLSWVVIKRVPNRPAPVVHVLGRYPALTLKRARELAVEVLGVISEGKTPKEVQAEQQAEVAKKRADTMAVAVEAFIKYKKASGLRSLSETVAVLQQDWLGRLPVRSDPKSRRITGWVDGPEPLFRDTPVIDMRRKMIIARLDEIRAARGIHAARKALACGIRPLMNWCAEGERFGVEVSVCANIKDKTLGIKAKDLKRKRVLDDAEIADVWWGVEQIGYPYEAIVKLLLLTIQRLNDIACAQWPEIAGDPPILRIGPERYKTGVSQEVPLSPEAVAILNTVPRMVGPYIFPGSTGKKPISCFSYLKKRLDKLIAERRAAEGRPPMKPWTHHDLRRSGRSRLGELGTERAISELVIGHQRPDLDQVYDQYNYRPQKRAALEAWAKALMQIVDSKTITGKPLPVILTAPAIAAE